MPIPTNTSGFGRTESEGKGIANVVEFLEFLGQIGAHCTVQICPVMPNNIVSFNYVCITDCAPVVLQQIMMHYQTHAVSVKTYSTPHSGMHSGVFVDTSFPKERAPNQD